MWLTKSPMMSSLENDNRMIIFLFLPPRSACVTCGWLGSSVSWTGWRNISRRVWSSRGRRQTRRVSTCVRWPPLNNNRSAVSRPSLRNPCLSFVRIRRSVEWTPFPVFKVSLWPFKPLPRFMYWLKPQPTRLSHVPCNLGYALLCGTLRPGFVEKQKP